MIQFPALRMLIGEQNTNELVTGGETALKACYSRLLHLQEEEISKCVEALKLQFDDEQRCDEIGTIFAKLNKDFPNDVGILSIFFLNIVKLQPGEAIYLAANVPHAYLDGDCIECMACSDNVIRAGLTPKFKDVETLLRMLNYEGVPSAKRIFSPKIYSDELKYTKMFIPEVKDFAVAKIQVPKTEGSYKLFNRSFGSMLLVLSGKAELSFESKSLKVKRGSIIFIPASCGPDISIAIASTNEDFIAYQAMYNDF